MAALALAPRTWDIETEVPEASRALARAINSSPWLGDPDPTRLSEVEIGRALRQADQFGLAGPELDGLRALLKQDSDRAAEQLLGPARLEPDGSLRRRTRIICTIGPRCSDPDTLAEMISSGMDVARLNFSHIKTFEEARTLVDNLHLAMRKAGRNVTILADLPGPKLRVGALSAPLLVKTGDALTLGGQLPVDPPQLLDDLKPGERIFIDDGKIALQVEEGGLARVLVGGTIKPQKGFNLPDTTLTERVPTARDIERMTFAKRLGITLLAASFVEEGEDIRRTRAAYAAIQVEPLYPLEGPVRVMAKMERPRAIRNAAEILREADGGMVARGDLAVECGDELVPVMQQQLHRQASRLGKPCGTATQMLASLQNADRPLRAEASDVGRSVLEGAEFVMTSEETAMGEHPVEVVRWMDRLVTATEQALRSGDAVPFI